MKHTPGPWRQGDRQSIGICSVDGQHVVDVDGYGLSSGRNQANIQLIAAAPEMLEALKASLLLYDLPSAVFTGTTRAIMDQIRAAISKAEGKAP